jgi:trehalose/maltose transport system permease protein
MKRLAAWLLAFAALGPFAWAFLTSLKSGSDLLRVGFVGARLGFENYAAVFREQAFGRNLLNSFVVAAGSVALGGLLALLAAYPLARQSFRGRRPILMATLFVSMFPQIAILSGVFELVRWLGLFNQRGALILTYLIFTLPFTIWTLTVFMRGLPRGIEEAARLDGAGPLTILFRVFLPMLGPAVATTSILAFIAAWNEFLFALTLTLTDRARTVPVAVALMSGASEHEIPWGRIMAASIIVTLPLVALVALFQRRIVAGLTAGAVKG